MRVQGALHGVLARVRVPGPQEFGLLGFLVFGLEFRVQGLGFRGLGYGVLGFWVRGQHVGLGWVLVQVLRSGLGVLGFRDFEPFSGSRDVSLPT